MAAHLSHKIRWKDMVDYLTFCPDGITLPVGDCGRIHAKKKKHLIQIKMRKYITDDMICMADDCLTTGERVFRKTNKTKLFVRKRHFFELNDGQAVGKPDKKLKIFYENLCDAAHEFASTELTGSIKPTVYDRIIEEDVGYDDLNLLSCGVCNEIIRYLEFGDKQKLFELSESELASKIFCRDPDCYNPSIGDKLQYLLDQILRFYIYSNVVVYLDLTDEDKWPYFLKPESHYRRELMHAHSGQTFLPHSRHLLAKAMIDLDETRELSKRLFRFIYFYVMVRLKLDSSYKLKDDIPYWLFQI